jgi:hypothetical protein
MSDIAAAATCKQWLVAAGHHTAAAETVPFICSSGCLWLQHVALECHFHPVRNCQALLTDAVLFFATSLLLVALEGNCRIIKSWLDISAALWPLPGDSVLRVGAAAAQTCASSLGCCSVCHSCWCSCINYIHSCVAAFWSSFQCSSCWSRVSFGSSLAGGLDHH